jgi:hypothetical protein
MSDSTQTLGEVTAAYAEQFGFTNTGADRIWFHDLCRVFAGELRSEYIITTDGKDWRQQPTNRSEILAAVYQAVLLNEREIKPNQKELFDGGDAPAFRTVFNQVIPQAMKFLKRDNVNIAAQVSETELREHFQIAGFLGRALERMFGRKIGDVPREEIEKLPTSKIEPILEYAKSSTASNDLAVRR